MLSRPICPESGLPIDLDDCIYRCFEIHHRRVLQRRAARKAKRKPKYQQTVHTEQYQNYPSQPSISSYYSNIIQDLPRYQTLIEPTSIPSEKRTYEYSNIEQTPNLPIETHYQLQTISTPEPYHQLKEAQYTSQQVLPDYTNIIEPSQTSNEFKQSQDVYLQPSKQIAYSNENTNESQVYDSHTTNQQIIGSSLPTGTVEYTKQAYFSQEPISNQSNTTSYIQQIQSSDDQHIDDNNLPPPPLQTFDQNIYTNEQIVPQQSSLTLDEENRQNLVQQTIAHASLPSPTPSDTKSDEDAKEDQEIFDLRACICRCFAKFKNLSNQDQQERYQEQFHDIQQPILHTYNQQFQQIQEPIPPPISTFIPPFIPSPAPIPSYDYPIPKQLIVYNPVIPAPPPSQYATFVPIHPQVPVIQPPPIEQYIPPYQPAPIPPPIEQYIPPYQPAPIPPPIEQYIPPYQPAPIPPPIQEYIPPYQPAPIPPPIQQYIPPYQPATIPPPIQQYIPPYQPAPIPPPIQQYIPPYQPAPIPPPIQQYIPPYQPAPIPPPQIDQTFPRIDANTGLCLVPCPETIKYAHLPPHLRPELFCTELPPVSALPPPPPPPPPALAAIAQSDRWCVRCCCVPGQSLIKTIIDKQIEEEQQQEEESYIDYASVMDQLETKISVRYGNSIMEEGETFVCGNYNEQLRIIDFPVYISGENGTDMRQLIPDT